MRPFRPLRRQYPLAPSTADVVGQPDKQGMFLDNPDYQLFLTLARGEWSISGFRAP
jgi:hypothetical protein